MNNLITATPIFKSVSVQYRLQPIKYSGIVQVFHNKSAIMSCILCEYLIVLQLTCYESVVQLNFTTCL